MRSMDNNNGQRFPPGSEGGAPRGNLPPGSKVRNTFLQFEDTEEDPWMVQADPRRQKTDSILERQGGRLVSELERNILHTLQRSHLGLGDSSSSSNTPCMLGSADPPFGGQLPSFVTPGFAERAIPRHVGEESFGYTGYGLGHDEAKLGSPYPVSPTLGQTTLGQTLAQASVGRPNAAAELPLSISDMAQALFLELGGLPSFEDGQEPLPTGSCVHDMNNVGKVHTAGRFTSGLSDPPAYSSEEVEDDSIRVDPAVAAMREVAALGGGLSGCTTVMVRHIPCKYTQRKLMREINSAGFLGRYDFFYLPLDPRSHANRGFGFLNFVTPESAEEFYRGFHGKRLKHFNSDKVIAVMPADLQGFEQNAAHYTASRLLRRKRATHSKPLFFRCLPEHLTVDDNVEVLLDQPLCPSGPAQDMRSAASWQTVQLPQAPVNWGVPDRATPARATPSQTSHNIAQELIASLDLAGYSNQPQAFNGVASNFSRVTRSPARDAYPEQRVVREAKGPGGASPVPKFCGFCGNPRQMEHTFCSYCGAKFQAGMQ